MHSKTPRRIQKRLFRCIECGAVTPATKHKGRTNPGHRKQMYCFRCARCTQHEQIE